MEKYSLLRSRVSAVADRYGAQLLVPEAATDGELRTVHTPEYVRAVATGRLSEPEVRRIGFPWSPELVERSRRSVGGTIGAARAALEEGVGVNLAGGTHHAFPDRGEGFCVFNDVAVAIESLRSDGSARRFAVVDLDAHQGNGTAFIYASDPDVFTGSVHGSANFPFRKERSDLDIGLPDRAGDEEFLEATSRVLDTALAQSPELVFYVAGADAFEGDRLGRLSVSKEALAERDRRVVSACRNQGVALALVMSGGYAEDVRDTVDIHYHSVLTALESSVGVSAP